METTKGSDLFRSDTGLAIHTVPQTLAMNAYKRVRERRGWGEQVPHEHSYVREVRGPRRLVNKK